MAIFVHYVFNNLYRNTFLKGVCTPFLNSLVTKFGKTMFGNDLDTMSGRRGLCCKSRNSICFPSFLHKMRTPGPPEAPSAIQSLVQVSPREGRCRSGARWRPITGHRRAPHPQASVEPRYVVKRFLDKNPPGRQTFYKSRLEFPTGRIWTFCLRPRRRQNVVSPRPAECDRG